jgi:hypothetical protein
VQRPDQLQLKLDKAAGHAVCELRLPAVAELKAVQRQPVGRLERLQRRRQVVAALQELQLCAAAGAARRRQRGGHGTR